MKLFLFHFSYENSEISLKRKNTFLQDCFFKIFSFRIWIKLQDDIFIIILIADRKWTKNVLNEKKKYLIEGTYILFYQIFFFLVFLRRD